MKRPRDERAASGSSGSRTAARDTRDHESTTAPWCHHVQSTGKPPRKGHEHSDCKAWRRCRRARRYTACGLPSAAPAAGGYSAPRRHSTAPRSDRPRTTLRREGLRHPFAKTVKLFRRGHKALRALTGAKRAPRQVRRRTRRHRPRGPNRVGKGWDRARTTLRVKAQRCSGAAVRGLPLAAPVQELQPVNPLTTSPERLRGAFASKARAGHLAEALSTVIFKHCGVPDELCGIQCAGCLRQRQRVQRATSAQHSSAKRPSAH